MSAFRYPMYKTSPLGRETHQGVNNYRVVELVLVKPAGAVGRVAASSAVGHVAWYPSGCELE